MSLAVNFEYPYNSGSPTGQSEFDLGSKIGVLIKGDTNVECPFLITIVWSDPSLSEFSFAGKTSFTGDANVAVTLPNIKTTGIVVYESRSTFFTHTISLGLGVGESAPIIENPKPTNWLLIGGIGLGAAVVVGMVARKFINK
jgi:hypothetical protein